MAGIKQKLDRQLYKYVPSLQGVMISYGQVQLVRQSAGRIINDCPFFHFAVLVKATALCPQISAAMTGYVVAQTCDHV